MSVTVFSKIANLKRVNNEKQGVSGRWKMIGSGLGL
jgi:hypothetical protein